MRNRFLRLVPALVMLIPQLALTAEWAAYQSDNLIVYSNARESEAMRTAEEFEVFRQLALTMLNLPDEPENDRLKIFVFDRAIDFNRINPNRDAIGFFYHSIFGPRMIVGPQNSEDTRRTLFHEYVHYLMSTHFAVNYPTWYSEGVAELLAAVEINRSSIVVGAPPSYGLWRPASVADVVTRNFARTLSDFYQMSWLMVHHFLIESYEDPTRAEQTADYIRRYDAGEDPVDAFIASYGLAPEELSKELNIQRPNRSFTTIRFPRFEYTGTLGRRVLEPGEDLYVLGDIALELNQIEGAHDYFDSFEELAIDSPLSTNVKSGRSIAYIHEDRVSDGDVLIDELLAQNDSDAGVLADIAHYAFDRYVYALNNAEAQSAIHLTRSIEFGELAVEEDPADLEALYYLGLAYELAGELQKSADTLLESYDSNPSVALLNLNLARVLIKGRQIELGSYLLSRAYSSTHSDETRTRIRNIQRQIEDENFDIETIDELL